MILIIGGAYKWKLDFAKKDLKIDKRSIAYTNRDREYVIEDMTTLYGYEEVVLSQIRGGISPSKWLLENISSFKGKVIIAQDMSCGVVPIEKEQRALLEELGKCLRIFSNHRDEVYRLFCGISDRLT